VVLFCDEANSSTRGDCLVRGRGFVLGGHDAAGISEHFGEFPPPCGGSWILNSTVLSAVVRRISEIMQLSHEHCFAVLIGCSINHVALSVFRLQLRSCFPPLPTARYLPSLPMVSRLRKNPPTSRATIQCNQRAKAQATQRAQRVVAPSSPGASTSQAPPVSGTSNDELDSCYMSPCKQSACALTVSLSSSN